MIRNNIILDIVDIRIDNFIKNPHQLKYSANAPLNKIKEKLKELHKSFVFAPADKAANNTIIIWKRYYIETLTSELSTTKTYIKTDDAVSNVLASHLSKLSEFKISISKSDLPIYYIAYLN